MENNNGVNKGLIVLVVVLSILLIITTGYICYDKFYEKEPVVDENVSQQEFLVKENSFKLDQIDCSGNDVCEKSVKLSYNGSNHDVKLVKKISENDKYVIEVYIDNSLVDSIVGGSFYDWHTEDTASSWVANLDGYIYVIDSKYLAIVYRYEDFKPSWYLKFYNDKQSVNYKKVMVAAYGTSFHSKSVNDGKDLFILDALKFDGKTINYWNEYCNNDVEAASENNIVIAKHSITYDGTKVIDTISEIVKDGEGGGYSICG